MKGIDIYSGTKITSWQQLKDNGVQVVYIKATDGKTYVNPLIDAQYKGAKSVGMLVGFYHFAENNSVQDEYNHFKNTIKNYQQDLRPCLDYEVANPSFPFIKLFMAQDKNLIFYSSHSIADIWIAEPGTNPSNTKGYAGIQSNWHGSINGLNGDCDIDLFSDLILNKGITINNIVGSVEAMIMKQGETSPRVKLLQGILNVLIGNVATDGVYGVKTATAMKKYQAIVKIPQSGEVGTGDIVILLADLKKNWFKL